jgi:hypothetical protein
VRIGSPSSDGCVVSTTSWHGAWLLQSLHEGAGHAQVEQLRHALRELVEALDAERPRHAVRRAERVHQHGHVVAVDALEEQRHVAIGRALRHAVDDLGDLEVARDRDRDAAQAVSLLQQRHELREARGGGERIAQAGAHACRLWHAGDRV